MQRLLIRHSFFLVLTLLIVPLASAAWTQGAAIHGQLLKSTGRPLPYTEIELVPIAVNHIINDSRLIGVSSLSGKFTFLDVPPGLYTLSINFDDKPTELSPYGTYFYPAAISRADAEVIEITPASPTRTLTFKLPPALREKKISGTVKWSDGSPAKEAFIGCRDIEYDRSVSFTCAKTDINGRFTMKGFIGRKYQVGAIVFDKPFSDKREPLSVIAAGETSVFDLELTTPALMITVSLAKDLQPIVDKYLS